MRPKFRDTPRHPEGARAEFERQRERFREGERLRAIAATPGGRAHLMRGLFLEREAQVRASIEATDDATERARLAANADELGHLAENAEQQAQEFHAMNTAQHIMDDAQKRLRAIAQRYALVSEDGDATSPPSDLAWRSEQRAALRKEWQQVESQAYADATAWRDSERQRNLALYHEDPVADPAAESRRVADQLETAALTSQYMGNRVSARNHLLPEAHQALAVGNVGRARVLMDAAKRVGVEDARLEHAIRTTLDQTVPHRKAALEGLGRIEQTVDDLRLAIVTERIAAGVGTQQEQVRDSSYRKMIEWRRSEGVVVTQGDGTGPREGGAAAE